MTPQRAEHAAILSLILAGAVAAQWGGAALLHVGLASVGAARYGFGFAGMAAAAVLLAEVLAFALPGSAPFGLGALAVAVAASVARLILPDPQPPGTWREAVWLVALLVLLPASLFAVIAGGGLPPAVAGCLLALPLIVLPPGARNDGLACLAGLIAAAVLIWTGALVVLAGVLAVGATILPLRRALAGLLGTGIAATAAPPDQAPALVAIAAAALAISWLTDTRRTALLDAEERAMRRSTRLRYLLRSRDEATALAVHDLQSPIEAMGGMHKTLMHMLEQDRRDPEAMKRALAIAAETTDELSDRIGSILNADRAHLGFGGTGDRLAGVVEQALAAHRMRIAEKGIELRAEQDGQVRIAHGDDVRDVLDVLIDNALVHTPEGGTIAIQLRREPEFLALSVSDSGPGVPPERRARLFSQKQGDTGGRSGMGLFLAARRARIIGGSLTYAPSELGGAAFTLRLREASQG